MTDQNNKGSFNWWWVIIVAAIIWGFGSAMKTDYERLHDYEYPLEQVQHEELPYELSVVDGEHGNNTCFFADTTVFNDVITIVYPDFNSEDKVLGRWNADTSTIELMQPNGLTVQTVAHEVAHAVDTIMEKHPNIDPHFEAYLQGHLTWCVYEIMQHDIRCAEDPWCNVN
jgi:hypothetical protein